MTIEEKSQTKIENTKSEPLPQILTNGDLTEFSHAPKTENEINENKENNYHISESLSPKHENHSAAGQTKNTLLQYGQGLVISDILASFIDLEEKLTLGNLKLSDENVDRKMWPNWMPKCLMDELEISKNVIILIRDIIKTIILTTGVQNERFLKEILEIKDFSELNF